MNPAVAHVASLLILLFAGAPARHERVAARQPSAPVMASETAAALLPFGGNGPLLPEWSDLPVGSLDMVDADRSADQVRIEGGFNIRIFRRPMSPSRQMPPDVFADDFDRETGPHYRERKIGQCFPAGNIAGMVPDTGSRLILFLRDQRMIAATLERGCYARDFYSGFYMARPADGKLCVDRDTLLSRSGANCKIKQIRELVESNF